jgi:leader peptidase (prepilin peptidase)/N-methyltransferase
LPFRFWLTFLIAFPVGTFFGLWGERMIAHERQQSNPALIRNHRRPRSFVLGAIYAAFFAGLSLAAMRGWQATEEVRPPPWGAELRLVYHQILIGLILVATIVDWETYLIPDEITYTGVLLGISGAFALAHGQLIHLWVDWSYAQPGLAGPYFPGWFDAHRHWHGLAWSLAGAATGAALVWGVRALSSWLLGRETLGFGDVTLMAMIGSFLGWQPTVCAFLIAPLLGLVVGIPLKLLTNKPYVPYGPFLGGGALVVLFAWGQIWLRTRGIFGDWYGLVLLAGMAAVGLLLLLILLRAYRSIPGRSGSMSRDR